MSVKERLIEFALSKEKNIRQFEEKVGVSNGYVKNIVNSISGKKIDQILKVYPDLDRGWLMFGSSEVDDLSKESIEDFAVDFTSIKVDSKSSINSIQPSKQLSKMELEKKISRQEKFIEYQEKEIEELKSKIASLQEQLLQRGGDVDRLKNN